MNTNYSNNLLLQQQQQQHQNAQQSGQQPQQQQQHQPAHQPDPSMSQNNMDARLQWAQSQIRYGQNAVADMGHAKSAQLAEMMKRGQVPNQFSRHQPQQSFGPAGAMGLGIQQAQNGVNVLGANPQQQPFHDQHPSNMSQLSQAFPNMGVMSNGNPNAAASASLQGRNPSGVLQSGQAARPLDMMNMVQGQQPQNGGNKFLQPQQSQLASFRDPQLQFPQGLNQTSSADMFPDTLRRPSPHPGNAIQQASALGQPGFMGAMSAGRSQNFDNQQRMHMMQTQIKALEAQYVAIQAQAANCRGSPTEFQYNQKLTEIKSEITRRKEFYNRMTMQCAANGGQTSNNHWPSPNPVQSFDPNNQTRPPSISLLPNQPTHSMQSSPSVSQVSAQANSGLIPPRTIPTPQQSIPHASSLNGMLSFTKPNPLLPKGPAVSSSNGGVQGGNTMTNFTSQISVLGLDKSQFESNFRFFLAKRGGHIDQRLRFLENRPLDLYALHLQVVQEGGFSKIEGNENLWSIVAARIGYVQFPGTPTEPAKSGPGVAQSLQHLYKEYIAPFEAWYMRVLQEFKKHSNASPQAAPRYGVQQLLQMVNTSPAELQSQGVDEKTLQFLEENKISLQRMLQDPRTFHDGLRSNATQNGEGNGHRPPSMGPSQSFAGSSQQTSQQNLLSMAGRQQLQHHLMQQQGQHLQSAISNGVDMGARLPGQFVSQASMGGNSIQSFVYKPTPSQIQAATQVVEQFRMEYPMSGYPNANVDVPIEQQVEYTQLLDHLHRQSAETDRRLGLVAVILKEVDENLLKRLITILCAINQQRNNLASASGPRYIISLEQLKTMASDWNGIQDIFMTSYNNLRMQAFQKQGLRSQQQPQNNPMAPPVVKQEMSSQPSRPVMPHNRAPSDIPPPQPQPPQLPLQPQPPLNALRPPSLQPPKRKQPQTPGGSAAASSPSPAPVASAPTPVANTPTPTATASSPPATKSPKAKASAKKASNAKQRRPSKIVQSTAVAAAAAEETKPTPPATSMTPGKRPREEDELTPSSGGNGKSAGESSEVPNEGSPPKRIKTEWEAQPSESQRKQSEVVANIKTDEDATALFDQMTELIKKFAEEEGGQPSSITTGISETLDMLLKGYGPVPDAMDGFAVASTGGEPSTNREPDPAPTLGDPFDEFFDFSFGTDEDSKTPDLVSSSSTNPSPESNHDAESGHHHLPTPVSSSTIDVKTEDLSDPLRLGTWKEIDGGEAAYFQTTEWKYDSPMTSYDQPWAIFNS